MDTAMPPFDRVATHVVVRYADGTSRTVALLPTDELPPCVHCGEPALPTGECANPDCSHFQPTEDRP